MSVPTPSGARHPIKGGPHPYSPTGPVLTYNSLSPAASSLSGRTASSLTPAVAARGALCSPDNRGLDSSWDPTEPQQQPPTPGITTTTTTSTRLSTKPHAAEREGDEAVSAYAAPRLLTSAGSACRGLSAADTCTPPRRGTGEGVDNDNERDEYGDDVDSEVDSVLSDFDPPLFPPLSGSDAPCANPIDVIRARIHALGNAILALTEAALTDTGASLEDSLKLEHKAPQLQRRTRALGKPSGLPGGRRGATGATTRQRPARTKTTTTTTTTATAMTKKLSLTSARERSGARPSGAGRLSMGGTLVARPATAPAAAATGRPSNSVRAVAGRPLRAVAAKTPPPPSSLRSAAAAVAVVRPPLLPAPAGADARVSSEKVDLTEASSPSPTGGRTSDFYIPTPKSVEDRLRDAPSVRGYDALCAAYARGCAAAPAPLRLSPSDVPVIEQAPLYDASNAACRCAGARTWADVPLPAQGGGSGGVFSKGGGAKGLHSFGGSRCAGVTVLAVQELTEDERAAARRCLPMSAGSRMAAEAPEPTRDRGSFFVLYIHRHREQERDSNTSSSLVRTPYSSASTPAATPGDHHHHHHRESIEHSGEDESNGCHPRGGAPETYYRALYSLQRTAPTAALAGRSGAGAELRALCDSTAAYAEAAGDGPRWCSSAQPSILATTPSTMASALTPVKALGTTVEAGDARSASDGSMTPSIDRRIHRLQSWQSPRLRPGEPDPRVRRGNSLPLFAQAAAVRTASGVAGTEFYYYTPAEVVLRARGVTPARARSLGALDGGRSVGQAADRAAHRVLCGGEGEGEGGADTSAFSTPCAHTPAAARARSPSPCQGLSTPGRAEGVVVDVLLASPRTVCTDERRAGIDVAAGSSAAAGVATTAAVAKADAGAPPVVFLEVVVANAYSSAEGVYAGAARRRGETGVDCSGLVSGRSCARTDPLSHPEDAVSLSATNRGVSALRLMVGSAYTAGGARLRDRGAEQADPLIHLSLST